MCIKQSCHTAAGIWTKHSLYFHIIPIQVSPCCLASWKCWQKSSSEVPNFTCGRHQLSWKYRVLWGHNLYPSSRSLYLCLCLLWIIMKCTIIVYSHKTAFHAISAIGLGSEREWKESRKKDKRRKRAREEIGLVAIFHVTGIIDNFESGQGSLIWWGRGI